MISKLSRNCLQTASKLRCFGHQLALPHRQGQIRLLKLVIGNLLSFTRCTTRIGGTGFTSYSDWRRETQPTETARQYFARYDLAGDVYIDSDEEDDERADVWIRASRGKKGVITMR